MNIDVVYCDSNNSLYIIWIVWKIIVRKSAAAISQLVNDNVLIKNAD